MTVPLSRVGPHEPRRICFVSLASRNRITTRIHEDVLARLDASSHRRSCANCEDGYCYDCILLEMTDAEYAIDSALLAIQRMESDRYGSNSL
jgi:hypothetical protein